MLNAFALNSHINNDPKYDDDFFLVMDHAIAVGTSMRTTSSGRSPLQFERVIA